MDFADIIRGLCGKEATHFEISKSGLASAARLSTALVAAGRNVVFVVENDEELAKARASNSFHS